MPRKMSDEDFKEAYGKSLTGSYTRLYVEAERSRIAEAELLTGIYRLLQSPTDPETREFAELLLRKAASAHGAGL